MNAPRRTTSQLRFAAVTVALADYVRAFVATLEQHAERERARIDAWAYMPASELEQIARYGRGHVEGAVKLAHAAGIAEGRAQVRAELGLPPEGTASPEEDTRRLGPCPIDGRACPVPASLPRKDPPHHD